MTPPPGLPEGASYPANITMEQACGEASGTVSQDNVDRMKRYSNRGTEKLTK